MQQLADSTVLETSSSGEVLPAAHDGANGGDVIAMDEDHKGNMRDGEEGDDKMINGGGGGGGGNRWPRQETLALLKIRSDMDAVFRDSSLKGPLWEQVSRKLGELGYQRSAKKCKEKFENVYKYHKRTKESRSGKSEGKTYRFFDQLQALENHHQFTVSFSPKPQPTTNTVPSLPAKPSDTTPISYVTTNPTPIISPSPPPPTTNAAITTTITSPIVTTNPKTPTPQGNNTNNNSNINAVPYSLPNMNNLFSTTTTTTTSTSSSTASDEDLEEKYRKKRKWKEYFRRLTRQVLAKQEEMQKKFLEAIDKREREHMAQQDAWRMQEMARINREHELLVQERSTAAAKNAAVIAFLQKLSGQQQNPTTPPPPAATTPPQQPPPPPPQQQQQVQQQIIIPQPPMVLPNNNEIIQKMNNGHHHDSAAATSPSFNSSRWPKAEVHALIRLRTSLEPKYQENGPKAPLWEDISAGMQRLGYNRSSKRCKEKWENINKYFKKVKESNKQRREDSKTCPYFHELEALYKEKGKTVQNPFMRPNEMMEPLMVQPEQQWRPPPHPYEQSEEEKKRKNNEMKEREGDSMEEDYDDEDDEEEEGDSNMEGEEGEGGNGYEIVTNKLSSVDTVE